MQFKYVQMHIHTNALIETNTYMFTLSISHSHPLSFSLSHSLFLTLTLSQFYSHRDIQKHTRKRNVKKVSVMIKITIRYICINKL